VVSGKNKGELLHELGEFVVSRGSRGLTTVLIVDEAHHLSEELLEEVRLLTNLETIDDKLLQIVLVGQPELDVKLDSSQLRQLKQRISIRAHLGPLTPEETKQYIEHRLQVAGSESKEEAIFPPATVDAVYHHSRGIPRLINTICENALIIGYARQMPSISADIIHDVAREFRLDTSVAPESENGMPGTESQQGFRDLYAMLRRPGSSGGGRNVPLAVEASEYEPNL